MSCTLKMVEKYPDLERGESAGKTGRKHIPTRLFKQEVNLSKQARAIEATLDGITPFNAGKKKEEALSLLKKWFPQMENFSGQLKKYKVTINDLLAENERLEARAKASEKGKMKDTMERAKLESELKDIQRLVDRISRSILDFANMIELFQQYNVEFVSSTEKFDTSTPMGRAMLNICIVFAQPTTSYGDITRYFAEQGILFNGKELIRPTLAQMLRNPVYVQADLDVYEFFKSQGTVIVNDAADFTGMNGCYLYQGRDVKPGKKNDLKDQMLVLAPHEGIVPSDIWLTCHKKLMNNMKIQSARKTTYTWLAGKIKCGNCGYALMSIFNPSGKKYLRCTKRLDNKSCPGCGKIITSELEAVVYKQMIKKLASYKTLTGRKKAAKANPKIVALQVELAHVDSEIEKLVDSLKGANNVLLSYVNVKIAELDGRKQELLARIAELTVEAISPEQVS